uniref:Uncharacterized protein n=1 Tax=Arundo donax TaxID=35708 RepID=A0A0A9GW28_ARUDO
MTANCRCHWLISGQCHCFCRWCWLVVDWFSCWAWTPWPGPPATAPSSGPVGILMMLQRRYWRGRRRRAAGAGRRTAAANYYCCRRWATACAEALLRRLHRCRRSGPSGPCAACPCSRGGEERGRECRTIWTMCSMSMLPGR